MEVFMKTYKFFLTSMSLVFSTMFAAAPSRTHLATPLVVEAPVVPPRLNYFTCKNTLGEITFFIYSYAADYIDLKPSNDNILSSIPDLEKKDVTNLILRECSTSFINNHYIEAFLMTWPTLKELTIIDHTISDEPAYFARLRAEKGVIVNFEPAGTAIAAPSGQVTAVPARRNSGETSSSVGSATTTTPAALTPRSTAPTATSLLAGDSGIRSFNVNDETVDCNPADLFSVLFGNKPECDRIRNMTLLNNNSDFINNNKVKQALLAMSSLEQLNLPSPVSPEPAYFSELCTKGVVIIFPSAPADAPVGDMDSAIRRSIKNRERKRRK
jgi:hypothetical protein